MRRTAAYMRPLDTLDRLTAVLIPPVRHLLEPLRLVRRCL